MRDGILGRWLCAGVVMGMVCLLTTGCGPSSGSKKDWRQAVRSGNRYERLEAISRAAKADEAEGVPALITLLEDEDDVVRAMACEALRKQTGESFAFDPMGSPFERRDQVARWRTWWQERSGAVPAADEPL